MTSTLNRASSHVASITDNVDGGRTASYTYDALYRLNSAETNGSTGYPQWGMSWVYDRYGNRTQQNWVAGSVPTNSLTISASTNRISSGSGFGYDANGNMTGDGINALTYDSENHALTSSGTGGTAQYVYDGKGMRVEKCLSSCGSPTTYTVYIFGGSQVIAEYDNGASVTSPSREYLYNGSQLMATINSSGMEYHIPDQLSVRATTNSSGSEIGQQGHFPYGESWYASSTTTDWQFTTYERDAESGSDFAQARYDVNRLGRFSSPDPVAGDIGDPQSLNRYSYVRNRPLDFVDPTGMYGCGAADNWKRATEDRGSGGGPSADDPDSELAPQSGCGDPSCYSMTMEDTIPCGLLGVGGGGGGGGEAFNFSIDGVQLNGHYEDTQQNVDTWGDPTWVTQSTWVPGLSLNSLLGSLPLSILKAALTPLGNMSRFDNARAAALTGLDNPDCQTFLQQQGFNLAAVQSAVQNQVPYDATKTTISVAATGAFPTYANSPTQIAYYGTISVAQFFNSDPAVGAIAQTPGSNAYYRPSAVNAGNILHESLHNQTGLSDPDLAAKLGISGGGSSDINPALKAHHCF
jgi:RHS repeat-associated protein